jgi:lactate racemase
MNEAEWIDPKPTALPLSEEKIKAIIQTGTPAHLYENRRVLVLTPDGTRSCPLPMMVRLLGEVIDRKSVV